MAQICNIIGVKNEVSFSKIFKTPNGTEFFLVESTNEKLEVFKRDYQSLLANHHISVGCTIFVTDTTNCKEGEEVPCQPMSDKKCLNDVFLMINLGLCN